MRMIQQCFPTRPPAPPTAHIYVVALDKNTKYVLRPPEGRSGLRHCFAVLAVPPEILGLSPGSVAAGSVWQCLGDREAHGAAHNWPSVVRVREGLAGRDILVSLCTSDCCGGLGAVHADQVARCMVFPPTHWCGWLPGWMCIVSRSSAAWLGCVSEDAWLLTFASSESVRELRQDCNYYQLDTMKLRKKT